MNARKLIRKIHLWVGLPAGVILTVVGLTGSLYVFQPEVSGWLNADQLRPRGEEPIFESDKEMVRHIEERTGERIKSFQWPLRERRVYMFLLEGDETWYYLDQTTGEITPQTELAGSGFFAFVKELHTNLTVGEPGRWITATASLLLAVVMIATGLYLWWPANSRLLRSWKGLKRRLTVKTDASRKRFNWDLHSVLGFYFVIPLFLMAITGAFFIYEEEIQAVVDTVTLSEERPDADWEEKLRTEAPEDEEPLTIYEALDRMEELYPDYLRRNMWMYGESEGYLSLAFQERNTVEAGPEFRIFVFVDRYSGEVLRDTNPNELPLGSRLTELWLLPVHFGEFGGMPTRILWFLGGLMPGVLLVSGFLIWRWRGGGASRASSPKGDEEGSAPSPVPGLRRGRRAAGRRRDEAEAVGG